jgi:uncharacterized protein YndB with AHSA1/START domain
MADGPSTQVEVRVAAPPEAVWPLVTDVALPAQFSGEFQGGEWVDGATGPEVGARFRGRNEHTAIGTWETTSIVYVCEPERSFGWKVGDLETPGASWRFDLEPTAGGAGTILRQWVQLGPGPSGITVAIDRMPDREERIIERRLAEHQRNMFATVEGIKALAEGTSPRT